MPQNSCPTRIPEGFHRLRYGQRGSAALKCHNSLECDGVSRVDIILADDKTINVLEVNTIPGMTPTSLVPKAALAAGINFEMLVEIILNSACLKS